MNNDPPLPASPAQDTLPPPDPAPESEFRRPLPSWQDWLLVAINVAFVLVGLVILPGERDTGIVTLAFFGSCLVVAASIVVRKLRLRRHVPGRVEVVGGVPIRPKAGLMIAMGGWLLVLGVVLFVFGHDYPQLFRLIALFVAGAGAVLLVASLAGYWPAGYLMFEPEGLTIAGRGWRTRIPWPEMVSVMEGEYQSNPVLLIDVADPAGLAIEPPAARDKALKAIGRWRGYMGADFAIMTGHYGIDLPLLAAAVARYAGEAAARRELSGRRLAAESGASGPVG